MKYPNKSPRLDHINITLVSNPAATVSGITNLMSIASVVEPLVKKVHVISGNFPFASNEKIEVINLKGGEGRSLLTQAFDFILLQLRVSLSLLKIRKRADITMFVLGNTMNILPILTAKLMRSSVIIEAANSNSRIAKIEGRVMLSWIWRLLETIGLNLSDRIGVQAESCIQHLGLGRYKKDKICLLPYHIDTSHFRIKKELRQRRNQVGYVGRLLKWKGVDSLTQAIPLILEKKNDVDFLIGGNGPLFGKMREELERKGALDRVKFAGWIPHQDLPDYLNELRLFVNPSYTENGPITILEAMACGAPVVSTAVGIAPDIIEEGQTGFILEDNSPECIAQGVIKALEYPHLEEITGNARKLVEEKYSYEAVVKVYAETLGGVLK